MTGSCRRISFRGQGSDSREPLSSCVNHGLPCRAFAGNLQHGRPTRTAWNAMSLFRQGSQCLAIGLLQRLLELVFAAATAIGLPAVAGNLLGRVGGAPLGCWLNGRQTFSRAGERRHDRWRFARFLARWLLMTAQAPGCSPAWRSNRGCNERGWASRWRKASWPRCIFSCCGTWSIAEQIRAGAPLAARRGFPDSALSHGKRCSCGAAFARHKRKTPGKPGVFLIPQT